MDNLLYLSYSILPSRTANSIHVMNMCSNFSKAGLNVTLNAIKGSQYQNIFDYYGIKENFKIITRTINTIRFLGRLSFGIKSLNLLKFRKWNIVIGRDFFTVLLSLQYNQNVFYESHSIFNKKHIISIEKRIFKHKNFKKLIVISEALKRDYLSKFKMLSESQIIVAHDAAEIQDHRGNYSNIEKNNIGYVGHLYKGRGIELIFELAKKNHDLKFHIIGGEQEDVNYWKLKSKEVNNFIVYGYVAHSDIEKYYSLFEIVLAPYQDEVFVSGSNISTVKWMSPLKIFEYMSYKKAIITSDLDVIKEVIENENHALLCNANDIEEWNASIHRLINDDSLRNKLIESAYHMFKEKYTWENRVKKILNQMY